MKSDVTTQLVKARAAEVARAENPEQMLRAPRRYLEGQPGSASAWTNLAGMLLAMQRFDEAPRRPAAKRWLWTPPSSRPGSTGSCAFLRLRRLDEAEELFRKTAQFSWNPGASKFASPWESACSKNVSWRRRAPSWRRPFSRIPPT